MKIVADFTIVPIGVGVSLSPYVAKVQNILRESKLHHVMHSCGTNIEGDFDEVMKVIKNCHIRLHEEGVPRVHTNLSFGSRIDKDYSIKDKVESVNNILNK